LCILRVGFAGCPACMLADTDSAEIILKRIICFKDFDKNFVKNSDPMCIDLHTTMVVPMIKDGFRLFLVEQAKLFYLQCSSRRHDI
jgi:hypothetical protein